ncbi:MAG: hypothetical protein HPY60_11045 [Candidatus Methanofastidiosum sp.]|nr:hypothetical protein [Methanofastidiosum sp.]
MFELIETGLFKWKVDYQYCDKIFSMIIWADNQEEAIEKAVEELINNGKGVNSIILQCQRITDTGEM